MPAAEHDHPVDPKRVAEARVRMLDGAVVTDVAAQLSLVADVTRLRVLLALRNVKELCVGDLALALDATDDAVGYALRMLRTAGLVVTRKEGRVVYYRLADSFPTQLLDHCVIALTKLVHQDPPGDGR